MSGEGTVVATIPAGAAQDAAGNGSAASNSTDNTVTFDAVAPTVTVNRASGQPDPTSDSSVLFTVVFSEPVIGFDKSDIDFTGSTAGGTLTASINGAGPAYTVTVNGVASRGEVVVSVPAGAATDAAGNPSAASTATDNTVTFLHSGALAVDRPAYAVHEGDTLKILVHRTGGSDGAVTVDYVAVAGTAKAGPDFPVTAGTLSWSDGDATNREIDIPITDDAVNEGKETFSVVLSNPTGAANLGSNSAAVDIAPSDGAVLSVDVKATRNVFADTDGDKVALTLGGKVTGSTATYYLTDGAGPIARIDLAGTDPAKSTLTIAVAKGKAGNGTMAVGEVTGTGLKALTARKSDLTRGLTLTGPLGSLAVNGVTGGTIIAPSIGSIRVKGDFRAAVAIDGAGVAAGTPALKLLKVGGAVTGSDIRVAGDVGRVAVGSFADSRLFAGYDGADDGTDPFTRAATIGPFTVSAKADGFARSVVIAASFKNVTLASTATANGGTKFGFVFRDAFGGLSVRAPKLGYNRTVGGTQHLAGDLWVTDV
jgi:hypothetical protein